MTSAKARQGEKNTNGLSAVMQRFHGASLPGKTAAGEQEGGTFPGPQGTPAPYTPTVGCPAVPPAFQKVRWTLKNKACIFICIHPIPRTFF